MHRLCTNTMPILVSELGVQSHSCPRTSPQQILSEDRTWEGEELVLFCSPLGNA